MDNHPILLFLAVVAASFGLIIWSRARMAHHRQRMADTWHCRDLREESGSFCEALGVTASNKVQQRATVSAEDE